MKKKKHIWSRAAPLLKQTAHLLAAWADDLLLIAGGACFIAAAAQQYGRPAALAVAGAWLTVLAVVVARSKGGR